MQILRSVLRRLSRGLIFERRLPREFGGTPIFVSPEAALAYWKPLGRVDPFLLSMARELVRPGMRVWDIGANVGLFSFAAASLGAEVLAIEADPWLVKLLSRSVKLNNLPVTIISAAVSDHCGEAMLHISREGRASNSLTDDASDGNAQRIRTLTLDSLLGEFPPDVLKVDVEGMEYTVLSGARKVLRHHPAIFCEVSDRHTEIAQLLREFGYAYYAARAKNRVPLARPSRDTLALAA